MTTPSTDPSRVESYRRRVIAERDRLRAALGTAHDHQHRALAELLAHNADTAYGVAHGFGAIRDADEFRAAVPINDYAALEPWIDRAAAGEHNVLSADDPVV